MVKSNLRRRLNERKVVVVASTFAYKESEYSRKPRLKVFAFV
jgi:hypothetical protein